MNVTKQEKRMRRLAPLTRLRCSSTPKQHAAALKQMNVFVKTSAAFLSALGKDLGFTEQSTSSRMAKGLDGKLKAATLLTGMWAPGNGMMISIAESSAEGRRIQCHEIWNMNRCTVGGSKTLPISEFRDGKYEELVQLLLQFKKSEAGAA